MVGLYGPGMHGFIIDELELGTRVAMALDSENNAGWSAIDDLILERDMQNDMDGTTPPEWVQAMGGGEMIDARGILEEGEILRFSVKVIGDDTARPVLMIADAPVDVQMDLLRQVHDTVCATLDAMQAQIARSN